MARDLTRIGEKARKEPKMKFTSIYHFVTDKEHLRACYERIDGGAVAGIDGVTKEEYGKDLERNLEELAGKLSRMGYRPKPVKRKLIPKAGSNKKRPIGIPSVEDKIVQKAVANVLEEIYETEFSESSYGYRRGRTPHEALDALGRTIQQRKVNYVVEADIKGFFDHVNQEWLEKFLSHRVEDERIHRLLKRMLKAGVMEDGLIKASEEGVPQGGSLSPLLSNVYLHYTLDVWFERRFQGQCRGEAYYFRFADDFVACFQYREDAERFLREMERRLKEFHLEIEPSKTKLLEFGRFAEERARKRGKEPEQFDFLGFTHYGHRTRHGKYKVKRMTARKKFRAKLKEWNEWLKKERSHLKKGELLRRAKVKLEGHLNYYAITDNRGRCDEFREEVERLMYKWLNRQSQRRSYTWERFRDALAWVGWPPVRIRHNLDPFRKSALNDS
jgi:RNA-directed DNA polymerase